MSSHSSFLNSLCRIACLVALFLPFVFAEDSLQKSQQEPNTHPNSTAAPTLQQELQTSSKESMSVAEALLLGIVEGLTEYLPVSSTGHLLVTQELLGIVPDPDQVSTEEHEKASTAANAFAIAIQGGAILAVLGLYWPRCRQMLYGVLGRDLPQQEHSGKTGRNLALALVVAFLPAAVLGLTLDDLIKQYLFGIVPTIQAWIVGGIGLLFLSNWLKRRNQTTLENTTASNGLSLEQINWKIALGIGLLQCVAMWPGTSRSLMTIVGGLLLGLSLPAAVEFSFLLGVVTLGAATAYDMLKNGQLMLEQYSLASLITGFLAAAISAAFAIRWMVGYLKKHDLKIFAWYRIAIGVVAAIWYFILK